MKQRLWLRTGILLSIPLILGLVLLRMKLVRDRANVPFQKIVIPRSYNGVNSVQSVAFSPDSRRLAFIDTQHPAQIWNINENRLERKLEQLRAIIDESQFVRRLEYLHGNDVLVWRKDDCLINGNSHSFRVFNLVNEELELETPTEWKKRSAQYQKEH